MLLLGTIGLTGSFSFLENHHETFVECYHFTISTKEDDTREKGMERRGKENREDNVGKHKVRGEIEAR